MEAWVNGVSTGAVDDLVAALGVGHLQVGGVLDLCRPGMSRCMREAVKLPV